MIKEDLYNLKLKIIIIKKNDNKMLNKSGHTDAYKASFASGRFSSMTSTPNAAYFDKNEV